MLKTGQRRLIVFAITGICTLAAGQNAYAQSSVSLFGILDASILYTNKSLNTSTGRNGGSETSFNDSGQQSTQFGMSGSEDLGGGMAATFVLDSGISLANGTFRNSNGNAFGRLANVGLSTGYGTIKAGLQYSPFAIAQFYTDPRSNANFGGGVNISAALVGITGQYNSNAITYMSPEIAGWQASVMFAPGGEAGDFQAGRQYSGSIKYHYKSLLVTAAYYNGNPGGPEASAIPPSTISFVGRELGVSYKFGKLTLKAIFNSYNVQNSFDAYVYGAGLIYAFMPSLIVDAAVYEVRDERNPDNHTFLTSSSIQYLLSKTTTLYGQLGLVNNHGGMDIGLSINNALNDPAGKTFGASVGIRHLF
ncbi:porin [Paraburkholderia sp. J12]|uniref:porin n=1 Tax=Paraburkholderia sp. J12 TaxID=2805432 RepID=UPI002ABE743D|nr:porin [Paraburkholderia sp. J12]